jgi:hypothetical protein
VRGLWTLFGIPYRELFLITGACSSSKKSIVSLLKASPGSLFCMLYQILLPVVIWIQNLACLYLSFQIRFPLSGALVICFSTRSRFFSLIFFQQNFFIDSGTQYSSKVEHQDSVQGFGFRGSKTTFLKCGICILNFQIRINFSGAFVI